MDGCSIAVCFALKGLSARAIHEGLIATLGIDAAADWSVTRYLLETYDAPRVT
jgi:hypothetical protein